MSRPRSHERSRSFRCVRCGLDIPGDAPGTAHRNHCPTCLWSRHLDDDVPGDRASECKASMEPIAVTVRGASLRGERSDGEWALVHRCTGCDQLRLNRIAGDDNPLVLVRLAVRPIANPPFPLELLHGLV